MKLNERIAEYVPLNELERILKYLYNRGIWIEELDFDSPEFRRNVKPEKHIDKQTIRNQYLQMLSAISDSSYLATDIFIPKGRSLYIRKFPRYLPGAFHHHKDAFEINVVMQGTFSQMIGASQFEMQAGDIFFVAPNVLHNTIAYDDNTVVLSIIVYKDVIKNILRNIGTQENMMLQFLTRILYGETYYPYLICRTGFDDNIAGIVMDLEQTQDMQTPYTDKYMESGLELFLLRLLMHHKEKILLGKLIQKQDSDMINILEYIQANSKTVTLESLSKTYNYTPAYLSSFIKNKYGRNFKDILKDIRLKEAVDLMLNTDYSMVKIAELAGYYDKSYFLRSFKKKYGMTPSQFRKQETGKTVSSTKET